MPKAYRLYLASGALGVALIVALILVYNAISAPPAPKDVSAIPRLQPLTESAKPIDGWFICQDLGVGPVPGRVNPRQRFILCHPDEWEVKVYCLNPNLPNPPIGTQCTRTGELTYWCGNGVQPVKEYFDPPPPTPNFTPTFTPTPTPTETPTPTPTFTPTPTPTDRPPPGGPGFGDLLSERVFPILPTSTATPFEPYHPSPTPDPSSQPSPTPGAAEIAAQAPTGIFYGIDFNNHQDKVRIKIIPQDKRVNGGKPITITFIPGQKCEFGNHKACVNTSRHGENGETIYLTIHSGIGGEGQAYRHAMEGTGYDQAALSLKEIQKNVSALAGAQVVITQGDKQVGGFTLRGTSRVPARSVQAYFDLPLPEALGLAAQVDPSLQPYVAPNQPQIVFETCGWRAPGESWVRGLRNTRAAVYIGVIQKGR